MAKKINNKDFFEDGFGKPLLDFFKTLNTQIDESTKKIQGLAAELKKEVSANKLTTGADVQKLSKQKEQTESIKKLYKEQEQARKQLLKIAEQEAKREAQIETARRKEIQKTIEFEKREKIKLANELIRQKKKEEVAAKRASDKLKKEQEKQIARQKKLIQQNKAEEGSLQQLRQQLKLNIKAFDSLSREERENTQVGKVLEKEIKRLQTELLKLEQATGRSQRNVGNYTSAWGKLGNLFSKGLSVLGVAGGLTAISSALRNGIEVIKGFSSANAELAGVLGKTRAETSELQAQQKALGATTQFSATQVAQAQIEFARLGQTEEAIGNLTPVVLSVATALKQDLAPVAEIIAGQLNAFGESSEKAAEFGDKLTRSTQISALNFERLGVSLPKVGTAADALGVSFDEVLATLGSVVDKNIEAEKAGTALRNIFLQSAKTGTDWRENLENIKNSTNQLGLATELFGKQNALVAVTIANNTEKIKENTIEINNAGGAAEKVAKEQLNTLQGDLQLLNSAWEGLILSFESGENSIRGIVQALTSFVGVLKDNVGLIQNIGKGLLVAVQAYVSYRTSVALARTAQALFNRETGLFTRVIPNLIRGLRGANFSFKALNATMKANILGAVVTLVSTLATAFSLWGDEIDDAAEGLDNLKEAAEKSGKSIQDRFLARTKLSAKALRELKTDIEAELAIEEKALAERQANAILSNQIIQDKIDFLKKEIAEEREGLRIREENKIANDLDRADTKESIELKEAEIALEEKNLKTVEESTTKTELQNKQIEEINRLLKEKKDATKKANKETEEEAGLLEEIEQKLKVARESRDKALTEEDIKKQQKIIEGLEKERKALLDISEAKKEDVEFEVLNEEVDEKAEKRADRKAKKELKRLEKEVKDREEAEKKKQEAIEETIEKSFEAAEKFLEAQKNAQIEVLTNQIDASKQLQNQLLTVAAGSGAAAEEARKSLAAESANQRKLESERERTIKRQAAQATILAALELTISAARRGESSPAASAANELGQTLSEAQQATQQINQVAGFFTGTENVSEDLKEHKFYDGKDGYAIRVHGSERIIQGSDNSKLNGLSNKELVEAGVLYKKGFDSYKYASQTGSLTQVINSNNNEEVVKELREVKEAFKNGQKTIDFKIDPIKQHLIKETKTQGKLLRQHYKKGRLL